MPKQQRHHRGAKADREDAKQWGRFRSAYLELLGPAPQCAVGDLDAAAGYLARIEAAIRRRHWTPAESDRLYRLRKIWQRRAAGADDRYNRCGTKPGPMLGPRQREMKWAREIGALIAQTKLRAESRRRQRGASMNEREQEA